MPNKKPNTKLKKHIQYIHPRPRYNRDTRNPIQRKISIHKYAHQNWFEPQKQKK